MGLLNNNNHRRSKRNSLRKQIGNPFAQGQSQTYSVLQSAQNQPNYVMQSSGNTPLQSNNLLANASGPNTGLVSGGGGGGGNMMGYMQLAAAATPMVMGFIQSNKQRKLANDLETKRLAKEEDVQRLMANRAEVRNPYANLAVATEAAEFQAQQVDQSLANTLDAMQAGGFGAGGATALAREAAKSKQGISADIQKQEATNQQLFGRGEQIRQDEMIQQDLDKINFEIGNLDRLEQREMDARSAQMATAQGGVSGTLGMAQSIMSNPDMVNSISGIFGG
jgi:hypothetical protein